MSIIATVWSALALLISPLGPGLLVILIAAIFTGGNYIIIIDLLILLTILVTGLVLGFKSVKYLKAMDKRGLKYANIAIVLYSVAWLILPSGILTIVSQVSKYGLGVIKWTSLLIPALTLYYIYRVRGDFSKEALSKSGTR